MDGLSGFSLSVFVAYGFTLAAWPILRSRGRVAPVISAGAGIVVLFCPLLIPAGTVVLRAMAAFLCVELMFKMLDYSRQYRQGHDIHPFVDYLRFLLPFPVLLVVFRERERRSPMAMSRQREVRGVLLAAALFATGFALVHVGARFATLRSCFPVDHAAKVGIFLVTVEALSRMLHGLERLAGFHTTPVIQKAFLSRTVAEFWCRYNTRVHNWLDYNVFRPAGGRRSPARGVLLTFFVSAILHELMFGIVTSRFDGYQFTFFMLQAPAVLVSRRLHRLATRPGIVRKTVAHSVTVIWMSVTSMFFFHGVNRIFPFLYASQPWLP